VRAKPGADAGLPRGQGEARPARHGPESGAARRTGRDDGRGPRASDRERWEAERYGCGPLLGRKVKLGRCARGRGEELRGCRRTSRELGHDKNRTGRLAGFLLFFYFLSKTSEQI
jgi:hypothetical protein